MSGRIIEPRRTRKARMLGLVEDAARAVARENPDLKDEEEIREAVEERVPWGDLYDEPTTAQDTNEVELAVRAYRDEVASCS